MAKKSKKKSNKKDQEKKKAQVDDQDESDVEVEDNYNLDHCRGPNTGVPNEVELITIRH